MDRRRSRGETSGRRGSSRENDARKLIRGPQTASAAAVAAAAAWTSGSCLSPAGRPTVSADSSPITRDYICLIGKFVSLCKIIYISFSLFLSQLLLLRYHITDIDVTFGIADFSLSRQNDLAFTIDDEKIVVKIRIASKNELKSLEWDFYDKINRGSTIYIFFTRAALNLPRAHYAPYRRPHESGTLHCSQHLDTPTRYAIRDNENISEFIIISSRVNYIESVQSCRGAER